MLNDKMRKICFIALALLLGMTQSVWAETTGQWADNCDASWGSDYSTSYNFTVSTAAQLAKFASMVNAGNNFNGKTVTLAADIDLTDHYWTPIGIGVPSDYVFKGTFDGAGHTISGINMSGNGRQGLFGTIAGATIKNLKLSASTFNLTNNSNVGGIVAYVKKGATDTVIENCHVASDVSIETKGYAGGIAGYVWSGTTAISGCTSAASIVLKNDSYEIGGIIGHCGYSGTYLDDASNVTVSNCLYYGTSLSAEEGYRNYHIGGILGGYYMNQNYQGYSTVSFSDNYYTYPDASVKGVGLETIKSGENTTTSSDLDLTAGSAVLRAHAVSASADIADMGTPGTPVVGGITPYTYGIKLGDAYYSHVLALENAGDYTTALEAYDGQTFNVKLRGRTLYKDGSWNTLCLPFSLDNYTNTIFTGTDCEVSEMDIKTDYYIPDDEGHEYPFKTGCKDGRLYLFFKKVTAINAGEPYLVKWDKVEGYDGHHDPATYDHLEPVFANVTINATGPETYTSADCTVSFTATYAPFIRSYKDRSVLFVGAANRLYYPNGAGSVSVKSFRAYFQLNGVQMAEGSSGDLNGDDDDDDYIPAGGGMVKPFVINIEDNADGIRTIHNSQFIIQSEGENCYDLNGRKMANGKLSKGIYIVNGKKMVIGK